MTRAPPSPPKRSWGGVRVIADLPSPKRSRFGFAQAGEPHIQRGRFTTKPPRTRSRRRLPLPADRPHVQRQQTFGAEISADPRARTRRDQPTASLPHRPWSRARRRVTTYPRCKISTAPARIRQAGGPPGPELNNIRTQPGKSSAISWSLSRRQRSGLVHAAPTAQLAIIGLRARPGSDDLAAGTPSLVHCRCNFEVGEDRL